MLTSYSSLNKAPLPSFRIKASARAFREQSVDNMTSIGRLTGFVADHYFPVSFSFRLLALLLKTKANTLWRI